jgi:hypothetical protein
MPDGRLTVVVGVTVSLKQMSNEAHQAVACAHVDPVVEELVLVDVPLRQEVSVLCATVTYRKRWKGEQHVQFGFKG